MRPQRFDGADHTLQLQGGTEENNLPCQIEDGWTVSRWVMNDEEREQILANGLLIVWLWWPNLIGVKLGIAGEEHRHTEETMAFTGILREEDGSGYFGLTATLTGRERELIEHTPPCDIELRVDMHPTCPVSVGPAVFE